MKTNVTFRHFANQQPNLHDAALEASSHFTKYYDGILSTNVEFINENEKIVQFSVAVKGTTLVVREESDEFKKSLALASDKMISQIKKWKEKHASH
jgi:ribosome-associated translation inhibitor RaiA